MNDKHYTPRVVADRMARLLSAPDSALVVDPACGTGELLAAVAKYARGRKLHLIGVDTDRNALARCRKRLRNTAVSLKLLHQDFLAFDVRQLADSAPCFVIMNPPFQSYGRMSRGKRQSARRAAPNVLGRFNLSDTFVLRCVEGLGPVRLVALLPHASYRRLVAQRKLPSRHQWSRLPDKTFSATITTGILTCRIGKNGHPHVPRPERRNKPLSVVMSKRSKVEVRNGVATGADNVFLELARRIEKSGLERGTIIPCARGREIARSRAISDLPRIWFRGINPNGSNSALLLLPNNLRRLLKRRHCVKTRGRSILAYHDQLRPGMLGKPKLILPEICKELRWLEDFRGEVLPLHSTIAISGSRDRLTEVAGILARPESWQRLRLRASRMVGGAIRLTVARLRELLEP